MANRFFSIRPRNVWLVLITWWLGFVVAHHANAQTASQLYSEGVQAYTQGDTALAKRKFTQTLLADKNFRPATIFLNRIDSDQQKGAAVAPGLSTRALEGTVVPIEFKDTTLNSALEYIRQKAAEQSGGKLQINFVANLPPELASKRITLTLAHVPVSEALRYIGGLTGVNFETQKYAIVVTPAAPAATPATAPVTPLP